MTMSQAQRGKLNPSVNPFTPVFGKVPSYLAGRERIISDMICAFEVGEGDPNLSSVFVGARGTGKTALLSRLATEASSRGWVAVSVTAVPGMLDDVVQRAAEQAAHLLEAAPKRKATGIGVGRLVSVSWENVADPSLNWRSKMNLLLDQLAQTETGLLITVDEVNPHLDEMVQLATTYQHFVREGRKVALLMAGLPYNVSVLLSGESTSFLRRAFRHDLGSIPAHDIEEAFVVTIEGAGKAIEQAALSRAVEATGGFPFMYQLVGYRMWNASRGEGVITEKSVEAGVRLAQGELRRQVFDATFNELSDGDVDFLRAMLADEGETDSSALASRLGKSSGHVSTYKKRLLEGGIIEEGLRGKLRFSLPGFREYLEEVIE